MMYQTATTMETQGSLFFDTNYMSTYQELDIHIPYARNLYRLILSKLSSQRSISSDIILPLQEAVNETVSLIESEYAVGVEMPEYDVVVNMPPREKYTITLEVLTIRKAQPNIIEPDWK